MKHIVSACSLIALTAGASTAAAAQQAERNTSLEAPEDEVIVTARKREERMVDVPIAISAVSGEQLEKRGAANLADFLQEAPGVGIYDNGDGVNKVTIRGISTSLGANENGYYLDDLPFTGVTVPLVPDVRAWDLDRVEVLRGPQGTLFGEGSLGGTIRILTKGADLDNWEAKGLAMSSDTRGGGGNSGFKGAFNAPIVPGVLAVRVAGTRERYEGWLDDRSTGRANLNDQRYDTFRAKVQFNPLDRLSLTGTYWRSNSEFPAGGSQGSDDGQISQSSVLASAFRFELYGGSARYDFGGAELFYGYSHNDASLPQNGDLYGGRLDSIIDIGVTSHELRLASSGVGSLQWTMGGYIRNADRTDTFVFPLFGFDDAGVTRTKAKAVFGEGTYTFGSLDITAGLRYYEDRLSGSNTSSGVLSSYAPRTYRSWNPRFAIAWHPVANATVYASAAKGFRSGQFQPTVSQALAGPLGITLPASLAQDSIWSYEVGAKGEFLDRRVTAEAALFYSDWKDVTVRIPIATTGFNGLINSEGTITKGVELSLTARPVRGLSLAVGGAYIDATYAGSVAGTGIVDGAAVDDVAKFTANASADYRAEVADDVFGFARASWQHTSPRSFNSFPLYRPGDTIDRFDARVGVDLDRLTLALFAENLTDERGATSFRTVQPLSATVNDITAYRLRPRTIGVEASFRFGGAAN